MSEPIPEIPVELLERLLDSLSTAGIAPPSTQLRARVLKRVADDEAMRNAVLVLRAGEGEWATLLEGVTVKILREDGGTRTWLARLRKGASLPAHAHTGDEECMVLEGSVLIGEDLFHAGDYQVARAGTRHPMLSSPSGCLLLLRSASFQSEGRGAE